MLPPIGLLFDCGEKGKKEEKREDGLPFFFLLNLTVTGLNACVTSLSSDAGMKKSQC